MIHFVKFSAASRAVAVALACVLSVENISSAAAQAPAASCSTAYYDALSQLRAAKGEDLTNAIAAMRAADPMLPGRSIYSRGVLGRTFREAHPIVPVRPCAEMRKVVGRMRCVRYGEVEAPSEPPLPTELTITPAPSNDETRVLKAVNDLVDGRGAVPDVGNNGRYTWLATRAASDLRLYISQPPHVALCSGATEIVEFYSASLKPLQKRADDVADLVKRARLLAAARVQDAATPLTPPKSADDAAKPVAVTPAAPAPSSADTAKLSLPAMTAEAVRAVVPADVVEAVLNETSGLAALQRAKPALILAQVDAGKADDAAARERVLAAGRAVRMIEAAAYAEVYAERYRKFAAAVLALPAEIKTVHAKACTCGN